jgi:hydrogenase/urease accessory protein HupE
MRFWPLLLLLFAQPLAADELRPAYMELTESKNGQWTLLWKASSRSRLGQDGRAVIPDNCKQQGEAERRIQSDNLLTTLALACDGPLTGKRIGLEGLQYSTTDALVRVAPLGQPTTALRLTPSASTAIIAAPDAGPQFSNVAGAYTVLGIEHILFGFDHLLFVLAMVLLLRGGWAVVKAITAFTVAHTITLIGSTLGLLSLPQRPVEAVIALSILFLAVEIVKSDPAHPRLSERFPWIVAFAFGLLHGFGFAGALAEIGLPEDDRPLALLTFNLGVEIGQLMIVAAALVVLYGIRRIAEPVHRMTPRFAAYSIGITASYWFVERVV